MPRKFLLPAALLLACSGDADAPPCASVSCEGPGAAGSAGSAGSAGAGAGGKASAGSGAGATAGAGSGAGATAGAGSGAGATAGAGSGGAASSAGQGGSAAGAAGQAGAGGAGAAGAGAGGAAGSGAGAAGSAGAPPGNKTTLRVHYPAGAGHKITVRGDAGGLSWEAGEAMEAGPEDLWIFSTTAVTDDVEWKPLIDDADWSRGPNYLTKAGATTDIYPHFYESKGQVKLFKEGFASKHLEDKRDVWVYLPPTYIENERARFPVLYMHDGQNLFDGSSSFGGVEWQVDEALDEGAESGAIREPIVVGVGNTGARIYEYTPVADPEYTPSGGGDLYLVLLADELKPLVDAELRTLAGPENTALAGSSLGGLISSYFGLKKPDTFGLIGAMSPSTWWADTYIIGQVSAAPPQPRALRVYVDSGDAGQSKDDVENTAKLAAAYEAIGYKKGVDLAYTVQPGASHSEAFWAQRFPGMAAFLLGPRPDSGSKPF